MLFYSAFNLFIYTYFIFPDDFKFLPLSLPPSPLPHRCVSLSLFLKYFSQESLCFMFYVCYKKFKKDFFSDLKNHSGYNVSIPG